METNKNKSKLIDEEEISMDDIHAYKQEGFIARLPYWLKAIFVKYWFFGAVCFFTFVGILNLQGENAAILTGAISGVAFDLIVYNILTLMDSDKNESKYYMLFKSKKFYSVIINVLYHIVLYILLLIITVFILSKIEKENQAGFFLREPFSQALVLSLLDAMVMLIKNLLVRLFKKK